MALVPLAFTFSVGAVIIAAQHNANFQNLYNDYNGNIQDVNIASNAAIEYSKLSLSASILKTDLSSATQLFLVPSGGIILWSGNIATIPSGWVLCNGFNGTPDLRNLFVVGADADVTGVAMSTVTGSALQTSITGVMPAHTHTYASDTLNGGSGGAVKSVDDGNSRSTGSTGTGTKVISVFYALAYIQKT